MCSWVEPKRYMMNSSANLVCDCMLMLLLDRKKAKGEACFLLYLLTAAGSNMSAPASLLVPNSIAGMFIMSGRPANQLVGIAAFWSGA